MALKMIIGTIGGLGLFLFGMDMIADALNKAAGRKLKNFLSALTKNSFIAVLVGTMVTVLIQSSSATTVIVIGFVNAGLLTLKQAIGVIFGANIGTTITAWIVSAIGIEGFNIEYIALPAIGIGFVVRILVKNQKIKDAGNFLLGLGILFVGIVFMEEAFSGLKENKTIQDFLIMLGENPLLGALAGMLLTAAIQSSSALITIIQIMALKEVFGTDWDLVLRITIPFILGSNIGTTITAQLAAIRTNRNSRRAAMSHTLFNIIGVAYILPLTVLGWYPAFVKWVTPFPLTQSTIMVYMAVSHSIFNIVNTIVFLPLVGLLEYIVMKIIPLKKEEMLQMPVVLEEHLLSTPLLAIEQVRREILRMVKTCREAVNIACDGLMNGDAKKFEAARKNEKLTDDFQYEITIYLAKLTSKELDKELSLGTPVLLHTVNDLERIGDHAVNIVEIAERKISNKILFSNGAEIEASHMRSEVNQMFEHILKAFEHNDPEAAKLSLVNENNLNRMQRDFRRNHVQRMNQKVCTAESGLIYIDLVDNIEKIGDHLTNIAQSIIGGLQWGQGDEEQNEQSVTV